MNKTASILKTTIFALISLTILGYPLTQCKSEFPTYRVVLDPGHGGVLKYPIRKHGDRYDPVKMRYIDSFKPGATYGSMSEKYLMYPIAEKTNKLLSYLKPGGDFQKFQKILKKYTNKATPRIYIKTLMSRKKSITWKNSKKQKDPNAPYRLFDYPDAKGKMQPGRLTVINKFKPQLVVSLHCARYQISNYKGMNPVLLAPYSLLKKGLMHLQGKKRMKNPYKYPLIKSWFMESGKRTRFQWFLNDTAMYYTAFNIHKNLRINYKRYRGYRYNMLKWSYNDPKDWQIEARKHKPNSPYSYHYKTIKPKGIFWTRERNKFEEYRRNKGYEGYGGDNAFASYELIRFIQYNLKKQGDRDKELMPGKPYVSIWIVPQHVNAICAYLELGYLRRWQDRKRLSKKQDQIAEGLAVGIYSLFTGIKVKKSRFSHAPKGLKLNLSKYKINNNSSYFDRVVK